jgi:hypothetical protein
MTNSSTSASPFSSRAGPEEAGTTASSSSSSSSTTTATSTGRRVKSKNRTVPVSNPPSGASPTAPCGSTGSSTTEVAAAAASMVTGRRSSTGGSSSCSSDCATRAALVNLCGGRARSAYRRSKRFKELLTAGNASWRDAVAFSVPVAYGNYRKYRHPPLVNANGTAHLVPVPSSAAWASEWADSKNMSSHKAAVAEWKALMELGQNLVDEMSSVTLSEIPQFCRCVSRVFLPPPDTTDLNQQMDAFMGRLLEAGKACRSDQAYIVDTMFSDPDDVADDSVDTAELQRLINAAVESAPCVLDWAVDPSDKAGFAADCAASSACASQLTS